VTYVIRNIGFSRYDWFFGIHPGVGVAKAAVSFFPSEMHCWMMPGRLASRCQRDALRMPWCPDSMGGSIDLREVPGPEAGGGHSNTASSSRKGGWASTIPM